MAERHQRDKAQRMKPALVFPILSDAAFQRLQVRQKISVGQNNAARLGGRPRGVKNFRNGATCRFIPRVHTRIWGWLRACHNVLKIVDDHRRWCAGQLHLLTIAQDEFHASILDRALYEIRRRSGVHRHNDSATQEDSPVTGNPLGRIGSPEKNAITWSNPVLG